MFSNHFLDQLVHQIATRVIAQIGQPRSPQGRLMTVVQAAEYIGKTEDAVRLMIHRGALKYPVVKRIGSRVFIDRLELDRWIDGL